MSIFKISAPLMPLLPDGQGYPKGYTLPKRKRNQDALNLKLLTERFRESMIYEEKSKFTIEYNGKVNSREDSTLKQEIQSDLGVIEVLSPYSLLPHVMIMELSDNRYLPGPESFSTEEWIKISDLTNRVVNTMKKMNDLHSDQMFGDGFDYKVQCCGFNWSPYAWGRLEETNSCQSIISKFHMMIWQWLHIDQAIPESDIPEKKRPFFFTNKYNEPFAKLILKALKIDQNSAAICGPRGVFIPFELLRDFIGKNNQGNVGLNDVVYKMRDVAILVEKIINHLNFCLTYDSIDKMKNVLEITSERQITNDELAFLRKEPKLRPIDEALSLCSTNEERKIIMEIYPSAINRANIHFDDTTHPLPEPEETLMKGFGYSLVLCESKIPEHIKSGLYICLKAMSGSGGVAETVGCYLTRPLSHVAKEDIMIKHNHAIWELSKELKQ